MWLLHLKSDADSWTGPWWQVSSFISSVLGPCSLSIQSLCCVRLVDPAHGEGLEEPRAQTGLCSAPASLLGSPCG